MCSYRKSFTFCTVPVHLAGCPRWQAPDAQLLESSYFWETELVMFFWTLSWICKNTDRILSLTDMVQVEWEITSCSCSMSLNYNHTSSSSFLLSDSFSTSVLFRIILSFHLLSSQSAHSFLAHVNKIVKHWDGENLAATVELDNEKV